MADIGEFWFKSSLFEIEPGEDDEINPGIYGKQVANWLATKLREKGYAPEVIAEDWGRCVMCAREPSLLWVGCGNAQEADDVSEGIPKKEDVTWRCFVEAEVPMMKRLFKRVDVEPLKRKLSEELAAILKAETGIRMVEEP